MYCNNKDRKTSDGFNDKNEEMVTGVEEAHLITSKENCYSPCKPTMRTPVFTKSHDRTRLTEYATALV